MPVVPNLAAMRAAFDEKREAFGEPITFLWKADTTYPPGTPLNSRGEPLDPTIDPVTVDQRDETVTATVATRTGMIGQEETTAVGRFETGTLMLNLHLDDEATVEGADHFLRDGERYEIIDTRLDGIERPNRFLVYGKLES